MQQEPLVLLGGYMCDARIFDPQISEFSKDRMVILPPAMTGRSMPDYIRGLLDHLPPDLQLLGMIWVVLGPWNCCIKCRIV